MPTTNHEFSPSRKDGLATWTDCFLKQLAVQLSRRLKLAASRSASSCWLQVWRLRAPACSSAPSAGVWPSLATNPRIQVCAASSSVLPKPQPPISPAWLAGGQTGNPKESSAVQPILSPNAAMTQSAITFLLRTLQLIYCDPCFCLVWTTKTLAESNVFCTLNTVYRVYSWKCIYPRFVSILQYSTGCNYSDPLPHSSFFHWKIKEMHCVATLVLEASIETSWPCKGFVNLCSSYTASGTNHPGVAPAWAIHPKWGIWRWQRVTRTGLWSIRCVITLVFGSTFSRKASSQWWWRKKM